MNEEQRIGAEFAAQMLGLVLAKGEPPADSPLAFLKANPQATVGEIHEVVLAYQYKNGELGYE